MIVSLRPVSPGPAFVVDCERCSRRIVAGPETAFARVDGIPFRSYWCADCASKARRTDPDGRTFYVAPEKYRGSR